MSCRGGRGGRRRFVGADDVSLISWSGASRDREIAKKCRFKFRVVDLLVDSPGSFERTLFDFRSSASLGPLPHRTFHRNKRRDVFQAYQCVHQTLNTLRITMNQAHVLIRIAQLPSLEVSPPPRPSFERFPPPPSPLEPFAQLRRSPPARPSSPSVRTLPFLPFRPRMPLPRFSRELSVPR